jgi:amino acid adenylation domain-containing protein
MATSIIAWLEETASHLPHKVAVADAEEALTFEELLELSRRVGTWVAQRSTPRRAVALFLEKSPKALAAMLGAVQAGCFYSVIDVRQTDGRIHAICEALSPAVILTDAANEERARTLFADTPWSLALLDEPLASEKDMVVLDAIRAQATDVDPLYCNFTSGSTGVPKGVVVSHRSTIDFIPQLVGIFGITENDVIANQAPFDFDVSVKDIYSSLLTGATLQLVPRTYFSQPTMLMDYLCDTKATVLIWAVSAMCFVSIMNGFDYRLPADIRLVMFSGEVMPPKQLAVWQKALPEAMFVNLYGPTEITCNCTYHIIDRAYAKDEVIPMGRPFPNEKVFLLDEHDQLVSSPLTQGEICVSGTALALGYLDRPDLTAAAFVQNPLNERWLEPIYRTGDLASYDEEGNLVYASRKDHQIKHLGQRIELGDIEASAQAVDGVDRACCLYDAQRKRLHLVYVGSIEKGELASSLKDRLPQYMVPNRTRQVDEMPLTKNGKVDRAALEALCRIRR